jgi:hypothetical protein
MYTLEQLRTGLTHMEENVKLALAAGDRRLASAFQDKINWLNAELDRRIDDHYDDISYSEGKH